MKRAQNYLITFVGEEEELKQAEQLLHLLINSIPTTELKDLEIRSILKLPDRDEFRYELSELLVKYRYQALKGEMNA
jgi:hypothetical protein